ncbi:TonB-dependent receptor [Sphingomonas sp. AP4-R1]|uniref:TonB-dependent receptor n=1 Tax=Sphingomonas sp. AP4-R1 TaxID=2735134 RepID=UPI0014939E48|nr:TonB-dependent receptor [Sphingomonas sp. AP4-R1]QJU58341.1 TonB-dependent receptor [Sphingomonas sp. AP4-R1]
MKVCYLLGSCAPLCLISVPAFAQVGHPSVPEQGQLMQHQPSAVSGTNTANDGLAEIVVTAQRRSENLQNVAISATALSERALTEKAVTRLSDLQFAAPSLSVTDGGLVQSANIRGIGLASGSPSVANGVATYADGLFQPPIVATGVFYDIASVEVLRGPQGTLVGSNSTGGAIFINSQTPKLDRIGGYAEAQYGNYNAVGIQGALNLPVTKTLAVRVAGIYRRNDSFYHDLGPGDTHPGRLDEKSGRVLVLWKPGNFQVLLKTEILDHDTGGFAYRPVAGTLYAAGRTGGIRTLDYNAPMRGHEYAQIHSAELKYNFDSGITLRGIVGYQDKHVDLLYDNDATELASIATDQYVRERQLSGEVNLISPTDGRFDWILGGYYQRNRINVRLSQTDPAGVGLNVMQQQYKYTTGVFAQTNYKLTDKLEAQFGLRYSHFEANGAGAVRIGVGVPGFPAGGIQVADLAAGNSDGRVTGKFALNYKVDPNNLIYSFAARGYKPGGYNSATSKFKPETVWNYEIGWKSTLAAGHLRTQLDAFYNDYRGFQFGVIDVTSGQNGVTNLPSATIRGIEAQVQAKFGGFSADASLSYIDSKLPAFSTVNPRLLPAGNLGPQCAVGTPSNPPSCFDYGPFTATAGGRSNLLSPKWTYSAGVQYGFHLDRDGTLTPRVNYAFVGQQYAGLFYSPTFDLLKSRGLLSAMLSYRRGDWQIEGFATNLTNRKYVSGQTGNNEFYGAPRQYGVRANVTF